MTGQQTHLIGWAMSPPKPTTILLTDYKSGMVLTLIILSEVFRSERSYNVIGEISKKKGLSSTHRWPYIWLVCSLKRVIKDLRRLLNSIRNKLRNTEKMNSLVPWKKSASIRNAMLINFTYSMIVLILQNMQYTVWNRLSLIHRDCVAGE